MNMKPILDIREMLVGMPVRLRYVNRFSTCRIMVQENVAEHSFYVAFYALMIAKWVNQEYIDLNIDTTKILTRALIHDLDEAATGDVPRAFKYSSPSLKNHLDAVAFEGLKRIFRLLWNKEFLALNFAKIWHEAKDDTLEGKILEFADFLSVLSFIYEEVRSSNITIREHVLAMREYYEKFTETKFDFLRPLIDEAKEILFDKVL